VTPANGRIVIAVILNVMLASTVLLAGTAAARHGSFNFGRAGHGWAYGGSRYASIPSPAGRLPSWSRAYPRYGSRQIQSDHRYARDYRQLRPENGHAPQAQSGGTSAPAPVVSPYFAGAPASIYGTAANGSAFSVAGLIAQIASAFVQDMLDGEMYGADADYAGADSEPGYDDPER